MSDKLYISRYFFNRFERPCPINSVEQEHTINLYGILFEEACNPYYCRAATAVSGQKQWLLVKCWILLNQPINSLRRFKRFQSGQAGSSVVDATKLNSHFVAHSKVHLLVIPLVISPEGKFVTSCPIYDVHHCCP